MSTRPGRWPRFRDAVLMYLVVGVGAAIGGVLRAGITLIALAQLGPAFPWGTMAANVLGSFVIGAYAALTRPGGRLRAGARQKQFVMTGICGGFTTFSVFSLETLLLATGGDYRLAGLNLAGSVAAWLLAVWVGFSLALRFDRRRGGAPLVLRPEERIDAARLPRDALALRIFIAEDDLHDGRPLHEAIVRKAHEMRLAGATVLRGEAGYGNPDRTSTPKDPGRPQPRRMVIEIVDDADRINAFLPHLDPIMQRGLVTVEEVRALRYAKSTAPHP